MSKTCFFSAPGMPKTFYFLLLKCQKRVISCSWHVKTLLFYAQGILKTCYFLLLAWQKPGNSCSWFLTSGVPKTCYVLLRAMSKTWYFLRLACQKLVISYSLHDKNLAFPAPGMLKTVYIQHLACQKLFISCTWQCLKLVIFALCTSNHSFYIWLISFSWHVKKCLHPAPGMPKTCYLILLACQKLFISCTWHVKNCLYPAPGNALSLLYLHYAPLIILFIFDW